MPFPPKHITTNANANFLGSFRSKGSVSGVYEYSFQAQEHDDEIKGIGNSINYKYRMHDTRLGRFFAVDPLAAKYPWNSPYAFSENRVLDAIELEGLEAVEVSKREWENSDGNVESNTTEQQNLDSPDQSIVLNYTNENNPEKNFSITIPAFEITAEKPNEENEQEEPEKTTRPFLDEMSRKINLSGNYQTKLEGHDGFYKRGGKEIFIASLTLPIGVISAAALPAAAGSATKILSWSCVANNLEDFTSDGKNTFIERNFKYGKEIKLIANVGSFSFNAYSSLKTAVYPTSSNLGFKFEFTNTLISEANAFNSFYSYVKKK